MAQPPLKLDQLEIAPSQNPLLGDRLIKSSATGEMLFVDKKYPAGISLSTLAGLNSIDQVSVVGTGSPIITITEAVSKGPGVVMVMPGVYLESFTIPNGVSLFGFGDVHIQGVVTVGAGDTVSLDRVRIDQLDNDGHVNTEGSLFVTVFDGSGTIEGLWFSGTATLNAEDTQSVILPIKYPDNQYFILLAADPAHGAVTQNLTDSGFEIKTTSPITDTIRWKILRGI